MDNVWLRIATSIVCSVIFCVATVQSVGAMQQSGYKGGVFMRWLKRKDNLFFNRLWVWALCLALASTLTALCFSFLGTTGALALSSAPFFLLCGLFVLADKKYALKVPVKRTPRFQRLFVVYFFFVAVFCYVFIALLTFLSKWNGSQIYALIAYAPFSATPMALPLLLCLANAVTGIFENARNKKFVKRAGQVLSETDNLRVAVVGSYGKTSVKNILKTILSVKYDVAATAASYNTPMGIALTVTAHDFAKKQVLIAEMGARKIGDIKELCALVKPQFAAFTGVCAQHIETFGSIENVWAEKSEILRSGATVVCGEALRALAQKDGLDTQATFVGNSCVKDVDLQATKTKFTLCLGDKEIAVETDLLGDSAVENIALAATLAYTMGLTTEEIEKGLQTLAPVEDRLHLLQSGGVDILVAGINCNERGAKAAIDALCRFTGRKCIVTPGIVECGVLEEQTNAHLGAEIAKANLDLVILVGETLVTSVKNGYVSGGGNAEKLRTVKTLALAQETLKGWLCAGDAVLFLNDLPDVY